MNPETSSYDVLSAPSATGLDEKWAAPESTASKLEAGRRLRRILPRHAHAELTTATRRPLGIIDEQNAGRLQEYVPLRTERMSQNPFAFYRGTAAIMAADLAADAHTGVLVPACGDAHISNFGFYASPQRSLVFDFNDFDEAAWGPLKRLITSIVIAGLEGARDESVITKAVLSTVRHYAAALRAGISGSPLERYYAGIDVERGARDLPTESGRVLKKAVKQARRRTGERAVQRLTATELNGRMRFVPDPPTLTTHTNELRARNHKLMRRYLGSARADVQLLLRNYTIADGARRIVGVGSVGTRCSFVLLQDGDGHAMIFQTKEAGRSVLEQYGGIRQPRHLEELTAAHGQGARVVGMQRVLQAVSDPFLGHLQMDATDLYVRQFHDMKGGIEAVSLEDQPFQVYSQACGITLARAHLQSPQAALVSGYVGGGRALGEALLEWGYAYAARSRSDFDEFNASHQLAARLPQVRQ